MAAGRSLICASCRGGWGERSLPKERYGESLCGSNTQPSNWEADTLPLGYYRVAFIGESNPIWKICTTPIKPCFNMVLGTSPGSRFRKWLQWRLQCQCSRPNPNNRMDNEQSVGGLLQVHCNTATSWRGTGLQYIGFNGEYPAFEKK